MTGIFVGLYYALVGIGLNLVFGVMRIVNLAHGDFIMLGAIIFSILYASLGLNIYVAIFIFLPLFFILGFILYYLLIPRVLKADDPEMLSIILFFGFSQVIESLTIMIAGPTARSVSSDAISVGSLHLMGFSFPGSWILSAISSAVVIAAVLIYLYFTKTGLLTRALMSSHDEATATGINVNRVSAIAFGVGIAAASVAGIFTPFMIGSIAPATGLDLTIQAFTIIIIGALGSPIGTILGGLILGISLMFMQTYFSSWAQLMPYVLLILILLIKPTGLLGKEVRNA